MPARRCWPLHATRVSIPHASRSPWLTPTIQFGSRSTLLPVLQPSGGRTFRGRGSPPSLIASTPLLFPAREWSLPTIALCRAAARRFAARTPPAILINFVNSRTEPHTRFLRTFHLLRSFVTPFIHIRTPSRLPRLITSGARAMTPKRLNHARQRTRLRVTAPASTTAFPPAMQVPRRSGVSLSLRSLDQPFMRAYLAIGLFLCVSLSSV